MKISVEGICPAQHHASTLRLALAGLLLSISWTIGAPPASAETLEIHAVRTGLKIEYSVPNSPSNVATDAWHNLSTSPADDAVGVITLRSDPEASTLVYTIDYFLRLETGSLPYDIAAQRLRHCLVFTGVPGTTKIVLYPSDWRRAAG